MSSPALDALRGLLHAMLRLVQGVWLALSRCWSRKAPPHATPAPPPERVIVVGAGFAGLAVIRSLANFPGLHVTLVDPKVRSAARPCGPMAFWRSGVMPHPTPVPGLCGVHPRCAEGVFARGRRGSGPDVAPELRPSLSPPCVRTVHARRGTGYKRRRRGCVVGWDRARRRPVRTGNRCGVRRRGEGPRRMWGDVRAHGRARG